VNRLPPEEDQRDEILLDKEIETRDHGTGLRKVVRSFRRAMGQNGGDPRNSEID